jgi:Ca-activated chloride channel family protein
MRNRNIIFVGLILFLTMLACGIFGGDSDSTSSQVRKPDNAVEISIIYAPESALYLPEAIETFNRSYADGVNPLTGERLASGEQPIYVTGQEGSSGTIHQAIINAIIAPNNALVERPTIFGPSVSHWLALVNFQTGREVFDLNDSPSTALAPVVMAIWESRLEALRARKGGQDVGWEELMEVLNSPNGWADYNIPGDRTTVFYGHTDPLVSSTALSTLIAEFYASAVYNADNPGLRRLTLAEVENEAVQQGVREIESLIKHYSSRTTEFKEYIAQGPSYLDFVALEENDLIYINQGKTEYKPPEKLVALYPKEGTFWHEHPFGIANADWVAEDQRAAAKVFTEYIRSEAVQQKVLESGFRPANPNVSLDSPNSPFIQDLGVDPNQPANVLTVPDPEVIAAVQSSWQFVKKQADVLLVFDVSGSMDGEKIEQARLAANAFLDKMPAQNRVGLIIFNHDVHEIVPLDTFEGVGGNIRDVVNSLQAQGDTALYQAIAEAIEIGRAAEGEQDDRIKAIVVLSDGEDTASDAYDMGLNDVVAIIKSARSDRNPVLVIPVAYGADADINSLNAIARASATKVQSGDPNDIQRVLEIISSYF